MRIRNLTKKLVNADIGDIDRLLQIRRINHLKQKKDEWLDFLQILQAGINFLHNKYNVDIYIIEFNCPNRGYSLGGFYVSNWSINSLESDFKDMDFYPMRIVCYEGIYEDKNKWVLKSMSKRNRRKQKRVIEELIKTY